MAIVISMPDESQDTNRLLGYPLIKTPMVEAFVVTRHYIHDGALTFL